MSVGFLPGFVLACLYIMTLNQSKFLASEEDFARGMREAELDELEREAGLARDMREAKLDESERVADDLREMDLQDQAHRDFVESELTHSVRGCIFCASPQAARDLGGWLSHISGAPGHEFGAGDLYVVSRTLAFLDDEGRRALGMFALVGDAALTYAVVDKCFGLRYSKSRASDARKKCTAWSALASVFARHVPAGLIQFPADVDPGMTRSGGEALEALSGLVARDLGMLHVSVFAANVGVFSSYKFE